MNTSSLTFPSDVGVRRRYFSEESFAHPAKLHLGLLQWTIDRYTAPGDTVGDPMAGIGGLLIAALQERHVILREVEPRWLELAHHNAARVYQAAGLLAGRVDIGQGDAREPWTFRADHLIFSPPYGCSAGISPTSHSWLSSTTHERLKTLPHGERWRRFLEAPNTGSAGAMVFHYGTHPGQIGHWRGDRYWEAMQDIYHNAHTALRDGYMVLVIKDHIRKHKRVHVADQTIDLCLRIGFVFQERHARQVQPLSLWQRRRKEQGKPIVEDEDVLVFSK